MNDEIRTNRGFTLIELLVAVGILAIVLSFASVIFKVCIDSERTAIANAEIMQKLRAITSQLDADFKGLRKDGEIAVVWKAEKIDTNAAAYDDYHDCDSDGYERFDRIMFFADGDFQSYGVNHPIVRGNVARICYMLARNRSGKRAEQYRDLSLTERGRKLRDEDRRKRVLARTQHILTAGGGLADFLDPGRNGSSLARTDQQWFDWNDRNEYDRISLSEWENIPWRISGDVNEPNKPNLLSVIMDVNVVDVNAVTGNIEGSTVSTRIRGATIETQDPASIHMLLCEGVGEFEVQGWYNGRWVPEVDPDKDGDLSDSNFYLVNPENVPGILYPYREIPPKPYGGVGINNINYSSQLVNQENFNQIPGLGRALKFTFTLYDSKGIIKEGRTFTHIVYLD
jgi:prepilin-type N-terminal cleavage/methylation domain-containing protein